jgi:hypothetical protein
MECKSSRAATNLSTLLVVDVYETSLLSAQEQENRDRDEPPAQILEQDVFIAAAVSLF